jgi:putative endonuclease
MKHKCKLVHFDFYVIRNPLLLSLLYATVEGFAKKYDCKNLFYYELIEDMISAISREKQLKGGSRKKKLALIEKTNPFWKICIFNLLKLSRLERHWIASSLRSSQGIVAWK